MAPSHSFGWPSFLAFHIAISMKGDADPKLKIQGLERQISMAGKKKKKKK